MLSPIGNMVATYQKTHQGLKQHKTHHYPYIGLRRNVSENPSGIETDLGKSAAPRGSRNVSENPSGIETMVLRKPWARLVYVATYQKTHQGLKQACDADSPTGAESQRIRKPIRD